MGYHRLYQHLPHILIYWQLYALSRAAKNSKWINARFIISLWCTISLRCRLLLDVGTFAESRCSTGSGTLCTMMCCCIISYQSINQSINHKALSSRATSRLKCYGNNAVRQSVKNRSEDEVWIWLSEEPCLEMLMEWRQRLSWRRLLWQGIPDAWSRNRESPTTDSGEPDRRHHNVMVHIHHWNDHLNSHPLSPYTWH